MSMTGAASILAAFLGLLLAGCSSSGSGTSQVGHYLVRVPKTPMYRYGPAQSFGPDFSLTQGQHVVMLSGRVLVRREEVTVSGDQLRNSRGSVILPVSALAATV